MSNNNSYSFVKEKLFKINGEYVKFYVTTNSKLYQLLANSGAAVIYHENSTKINYIYVGGELIASGYGVKDIDSRDALQWWADNYEEILAQLRKADEENTVYIQTNYDSLYKKIEDNFVKIEGGDISNTIIKPTGLNRTIVSKDIIGLTEKIDYDRFKVGEIIYTVEYYKPNSNVYTETQIFLQNDKKVLPVNTVLKNVQMLVPIDLNDNGTIAWSRLLFYTNNKDNTLQASSQKQSSNYSSENNLIDDIVDVMMDGNVDNIMNLVSTDNGMNFIAINNQEYINWISTNEDTGAVDKECISFNARYSSDSNANMYLKISHGENGVFFDFEGEINGTPIAKYKPYSFSVDNEDYDDVIYNTNNLRELEYFSLKDEKGLANNQNLLTIEGVHVIYVLSYKDLVFWKRPKYNDTSSISFQNNFKDRYPNLMVADKYVAYNLFNRNINTGEIAGFELKDLFDSNIPQIINKNEIKCLWNYTDTNAFEIDTYKGQKTVLFTLPSIYEIAKVYYVDDNGAEIDLTGYFIYCGCQKFTSNNSTISNIDSTTKYTITCDTKLYYMFSLDGFVKDMKLTVKLRKATEEELNNLTTGKFRLDVSNSKQLLHSVDYDGDHWFDSGFYFLRSEEDEVFDEILDSENSTNPSIYGVKTEYDTVKGYLSDFQNHL